MCENIPNPLVFVAKYQSPNAKMKKYSYWYIFFHDFQKFSKRKIFSFFEKLIFSQPRSPAPNGKPSHPRGGLAGKLQHCPVANISCSKFFAMCATCILLCTSYIQPLYAELRKDSKLLAFILEVLYYVGGCCTESVHNVYWRAASILRWLFTL